MGASGVDIVGRHALSEAGRRKPKGEVDRFLRDDETTSCDVDEAEIGDELVKSTMDATARILRGRWTYKGWSALVNNRTIGWICNMLKSRS